MKIDPDSIPGIVLATIVLVGLLVCFLPGLLPVQAAQPAEPVVEPCVPVNTAKVSDILTLVIFRCEAEGSPPYKINSLGFMLNEE